MYLTPAISLPFKQLSYPSHNEDLSHIIKIEASFHPSYDDVLSKSLKMETFVSLNS